VVGKGAAGLPGPVFGAERSAAFLLLQSGRPTSIPLPRLLSGFRRRLFSEVKYVAGQRSAAVGIHRCGGQTGNALMINQQWRHIEPVVVCREIFAAYTAEISALGHSNHLHRFRSSGSGGGSNKFVKFRVRAAAKFVGFFSPAFRRIFVL
jgi:hypothetical protein